MPERIVPMLAARRDQLPRPRARAGRSRSSGTGSARSPTSSPAGCGWRAATCARSPTPIPRSAGWSRELGMREAVLDGEIVAFDDAGRPSFERLQRRMHVTAPTSVRRLAASTPVVYAIFDLLYLDGHSLMELPYGERRARARAARARRPRVAGAGRASGPRARACWRRRGPRGSRGWSPSGCDSRYEPGRRNGAWLKIKHTRRQELVIGGWIPGEGRRSERIGALLMGYFERPATFVYAGRVGTGFTERTLGRAGATGWRHCGVRHAVWLARRSCRARRCSSSPRWSPRSSFASGPARA